MNLRAQTKLNWAREVASVGSARERKSAEALAAKYAGRCRRPN